MVFPVVMYGCESWTVKKADRQRIDAFEPWCWRRLLRVEIQPVHPKGDQSWMFIGRTHVGAETPILLEHFQADLEPDAVVREHVGTTWRWRERGEGVALTPPSAFDAVVKSSDMNSRLVRKDSRCLFSPSC